MCNAILAPTTVLKGVGAKTQQLLGKLKLFTVGDVLRNLPYRYDDFSKFSKVAMISHGDLAVLLATIKDAPKTARIRPGLTITSVNAYDESGSVRLVWYNMPYAAASLSAGDDVCVCGRVDASGKKSMISPAIYKEPPGILPIYSLCRGLSAGKMRAIVSSAFEYAACEVENILPQHIIDDYGLLSSQEALFKAHFPTTNDDIFSARRTLDFEQIILYQTMVQTLKNHRSSSSGIQFETSRCIDEFKSLMPFKLTLAQERVLNDIAGDMSRPTQMNRLIQGDVGAGKTVPALFAMYVALKNGYQAALMVPTEILAQQHFASLTAMFKERALILTSSCGARSRSSALEKIKSCDALAVVGTHALIEDAVMFGRLGVVIADEQHRFGVSQRTRMMQKAAVPDIIIMSATPIPRTLSQLIYGDLDLSLLDELPPGRKKIKTFIVPPQKRASMYEYIKGLIGQGNQAYIVCPAIESQENMVMSAAEDVYNELLPLLGRIGLIHSRMSAKNIDATITAFKEGKLCAIVSTTVIEVGIDVPGATIMVVENAERFGLSQLHQLRGRVGRGERESVCFLVSACNGDIAAKRLSKLVSTQDGFEIAKADLELRGPGELLGDKQHGVSFIVDMATANADIFSLVKEAAASLTLDELARLYEIACIKYQSTIY